MSREIKVAVCSRSFSANPVLRAELLARYPSATFNDAGLQLRGDSLVEFLKGHDKAITALEVIDDYVLGQLPELKVLSKYGVGLDMIDMAAMRAHGKRLGWTTTVWTCECPNKASSCLLATALLGFPAYPRQPWTKCWFWTMGAKPWCSTLTKAC